MVKSRSPAEPVICKWIELLLPQRDLRKLVNYREGHDWDPDAGCQGKFIFRKGSIWSKSDRVVSDNSIVSSSASNASKSQVKSGISVEAITELSLSQGRLASLASLVSDKGLGMIRSSTSLSASTIGFWCSVMGVAVAAGECLDPRG